MFLNAKTTNKRKPMATPPGFFRLHPFSALAVISGGSLSSSTLRTMGDTNRSPVSRWFSGKSTGFTNPMGILRGNHEGARSLGVPTQCLKLLLR